MRIGIDLGGTKIAGIVLDDAGQTRLERRIPTPVGDGYDAVVAAICALVRAMEAELCRTCAVGVGAPGQTSVRTGQLKNSNAVCLNGHPLHDDLRQALGRDVRMANDANCFTLSEAVDGAASGLRLVVGLILGTGVGGGIAINGQIHGGLNGIAGEWGHTSLVADGQPCYCGKRGCIETLLSGPGLLRAYRARGGVLASDAAQIASLARSGGCAHAVAAMDAYVDYFGEALAMVIALLDPDAVVLGGGLSNMPLLYGPGVAAIRRQLFNDAMATPILQHRHGDASGVRGAAMLWPPQEVAAMTPLAREASHRPKAVAAAGGRLGARRTS